jgi:thioredoxin-like negative regulator of GroEL
LVVPASGEAVKYDGELSHDRLTKFLKPFAKTVKSEAEPEAPKKKEPEFVHEVSKEVTQQDTFDKLCQSDKHNFCVVSFLDPTNSETDDQKRYLNILDTINEKYGKSFKFLWLDPQKQNQYVETFQLYSGFPSVILYSHKKKCYVSYVGAYSEESISEFLDKVLMGKAKPIPLSSLPALAPPAKDEL